VTHEQATPPDLVELTRQVMGALDRRDWDVVMAFFTPDAVWDMSPIDLGVFEGRTAIRGALEGWWGAFSEFASELDEVLDLGNGVAFQVVTQRGRPAGSSGELRQRSARVALVADGLIERLTSYTDVEEARRAAEGLAGSRGGLG
jgi:ketosteroid isomerase-like protein